MLNPSEIRDLVEQDKFELLMRMPFFGRIICSSEWVIVRDPQVRLACTDYRRIFISADTYSSLAEAKRLAVLAHEVLHIALRHAFRIGNRDKNRFEKAADIEVTFVLTESLPDPYGIKLKEEWKDLTAEQIYELLPIKEKKTKSKSMHCSPKDNKPDEKKPQDKQASDKQSIGNSDSGNGEDSGSGSNTEGGASGNDSGNGEGSGNGSNAEGGASGNGEDSGNGSGDGTASNCRNRPAEGNQEEFSEFHPQFDAETEMHCSGLSAGMRMDMKMNRQDISSPAIERLLKKLDKPRVKWEAVLRQFLRLYRGGSYSWVHPNRRFISQGMYLPGRYGRKCFSGIVALDTSPSTREALPRFVSELTGMLAEFGKYDLTIIECAEKVLQVWNVSSETDFDITQHKFRCGSGTKFSPVFEYVHDHHLVPNVLIYFTDGEGPCPNCTTAYPVVWMLAKGGKAPAPWGRAISYEEN